MPLRVLLLGLVLAGPASLLGGCATSPASPATAPSGRPIAIAPGAQRALPGGARLRFVEVASDSRCPPAVTCIHAGEAIAVFELAADPHAPRRAALSTARLPADAVLGPWRLRLIALEPGERPTATVQLDPAP